VGVAVVKEMLPVPMLVDVLLAAAKDMIVVLAAVAAASEAASEEDEAEVEGSVEVSSELLGVTRVDNAEVVAVTVAA